MKQSTIAAIVGILVIGLVGCGGPEERKAKYRQHAQEYFEQGNYPKARVALRNVIQIDPKDAGAYFLYAQVEEKEKNWRNAVAGYQRVVELDPEHEIALIKLGKYYLEARAIDMVGQVTDRVLVKNPEHVGARALKIAAMAVSGQMEEATVKAEELIAEAPAEVDAVLLLASLYTAQQHGPQALTVLQRGLKAHPDNLELLDTQAMTMVRVGQFTDAEAILQRIVSLEPKVLDHKLRLVAFFDQQRQYEKAETVLREAIRMDPDSEDRRLAMAEYLAKRRGITEAETSLQQARKDLPHSAKIQFALGSSYEMTQRAEQARTTYESIRSDFKGKPEALEAQIRLASLDWAAGKHETAERQIQDVLKENPRSADALLLRGKIALQRGNGKDATQDFRSFLKDRPDSADGHVLLARAYLMTGETMLARESLDKVLSSTPTSVEAQVLLAGLDASVGHIKEARERLDPLIDRDPGNVTLLGMMFQLQTQEKDWGRSQETLTKLRSAGADQAAADMAEGHMASAQQQWEIAEAAYSRANEQRPLTPEPLLALVQLGLKRGQVAQTQSRLESVLATHPDHPYADGFLGELLLTRGDVNAAIPHFEAAARLNPKWSTPWIHLARFHYAGKRPTEGDEALLKGLRTSPENEQMRLLLAVSLGTQGRFDEAIGHYEAVLRKNPKSLLAANNLASTLVDHKSDPQSLERALALSRAFESQAPNPYLLDTLGWAHYKLNHGIDAVRLLKQATALAPDHPVLNYHLGAALSKSGQPEEARLHLKKALVTGTPFEGIDAAKALLAQVAG